MAEADEFPQLMDLVRKGDAAAAERLVRLYEADLRLLARVRLTDPVMRRVCDSMDVCQSVLANFFIRASTGQYEPADSNELLNLLAAMVRNKVIDYARRQKSKRRDVRRTSPADIADIVVAAPGDSPSQIAANAELLQKFQHQLTEEERRIQELRMAEASWEEIAAAVGGTAGSVRKRWMRTVDRISRELGLEDVEV